MASKYETEPELQNENNSHTLIVELVGQDKTVLDVGAATGYVAKILTERGCSVTGIEVDPDAAREAEAHCEKVITGDIESMDLQTELGGDSFDVIVFGDVLEHLREPLQTLKRFKPFLRPDGYVVTSIPNVAHGSVRLALLQGKFQYQSLGLMDDTHLRFFTRDTIEEMFTDAGLAITELKRTRLGVFDTNVRFDGQLVPEAVKETLKNDPESETYQFVLKAQPPETLQANDEEANRDFWLAQLAERERTIQKQGEEIHRLRESDRNAKLTTRNSRLSNQLAEKDREIHRLSKQADEKDRTIHEQERKLRNVERVQGTLTTRTDQLSQKEQEVTELTQEVAKLRRQIARLRQPQGGGS
jgi:2-polyprenyl-3-methyl-5-hydroxy-6-metoxy-1,4-benzoquinol methylase